MYNVDAHAAAAADARCGHPLKSTDNNHNNTWTLKPILFKYSPEYWFQYWFKDWCSPKILGSEKLENA